MNSTTPKRTDNGREISHYRQIDNRGWVRYQFIKASDGCETIEAIHVNSKIDTTPERKTYPTGYSADCSWCYLGAGHSEAAHAEAVGTCRACRQPQDTPSCQWREHWLPVPASQEVGA